MHISPSRTGLSAAPVRRRSTGPGSTGPSPAGRAGAAGRGGGLEEAAVDRVVHIQELFAAGLHSRTVHKVLPCMRDSDGGPNEIATPKLVEELTSERDRIDRMITDLLRSREVLDEVIVAAAGKPEAT
ncbi:MerR family transcriptional regulator [Kitasatospora sp. NPDC018058]|uniref:MerR family transcriptional regulator n=1 Tax=Kitasatospora sp. NPDC018058 TaxID=3364025 RepID=UPI0037BF5F28